MTPITYYISELKNQLEALRSDTCPDPLQVQERLFHLLESLQAEREALRADRKFLPPALGGTNRPAKTDTQGIPDFPLAAEAELCLLELEAHAELPFSTPALRHDLQVLLQKAQNLLSLLPASSDSLRYRLEQACAMHILVA